jgi:hypothetical protein
MVNHLGRWLMRSQAAVAIRCFAAVAAGLLLPPVPASAQLTLQVKKGTAWTTALTIPEIQAMSFRWTWTSGKPPAVASWQITVSSSPTPPPVGTNPPIAKHGPAPLPPHKGQYAEFQILPSNFPAGSPSNFYLRVEATTQGGLERLESNWIGISVVPPTVTADAPRAAPPPSAADLRDLLKGGKADAPRAAPPPSASDLRDLLEKNSPPSPTLVVKLKRVYCKAETSEESASDEVYALLSATYLLRDNLWASPVGTKLTRVYQEMDAGEDRPVDVPLWGPMGIPYPIRVSENAIILVALMEHDDTDESTREKAGIAISQGLRSVLKAKPATATPAQIVTALKSRMDLDIGSWLVDFPGLLDPDDDDRIGYIRQLVLTGDDVQRAQRGETIKKALSFKAGPDDDDGEYQLDFELSKLLSTAGVAAP